MARVSGQLVNGPNAFVAELPRIGWTRRPLPETGETGAGERIAKAFGIFRPAPKPESALVAVSKNTSPIKL